MSQDKGFVCISLYQKSYLNHYPRGKADFLAVGAFCLFLSPSPVCRQKGHPCGLTSRLGLSVKGGEKVYRLAGAKVYHPLSEKGPRGALSVDLISRLSRTGFGREQLAQISQALAELASPQIKSSKASTMPNGSWSTAR
jgi:hypothetical protein